jgi:Uma2 family endonuclease
MATAVDLGPSMETTGDVPYHLNAEVYFRMVEEGILPHARRVYLWDGGLFEKMAKKQAHAISHSKLARALFVRVPADRWYVSTENPVAISPDKVPLPDLAIIRGEPDRYPKQPPTAADVELIVEVMDTSAGKDLGVNLRAYAAAGVPRYWVVNLRTRQVEVYGEPSGGEAGGQAPGYGRRVVLGAGETVVLVLEGYPPIEIPVDEILPRDPD